MARTLLTGARIFDGTGADLRAQDLVIDGETLRLGAGEGAEETVDLTGLTVLPGFVDAHVHVCLSNLDLMANLGYPFSYQFFLAERNLRRTLDAGVTTVRDASGADLGIQRAVDDGLIDGPALRISIIALSQTGGHGDHWLPSGNAPEILLEHPGRPSGIVDGPDEARKRVRELIRDGANFIKVNTSGGVFSPRDNPAHAHFTQEELDAIVGEAARVDVPAMAHAHGSAGIKAAIRAGVRSVEHGTDLDDEAITLMLERGTWLVPTLGVSQFIVDRIDQGAAVAPGIAEKARANHAMRADSFKRAVEAGVRIAMGSDAAAEMHGRNLVELRLMAEGGLAPLAVLEAATRSAAQLLGIADRVGTIADGKQADLVVVAGDPLDFAAYPENIVRVYRKGKLVRRRTPPSGQAV
ncbi:amidohydrolase family protein [Phytohabitans sp. ZYX-F-186]|uniref:Amidohydrolase family protein n=1 Tax=Phytohabitans maris TaxID=3071409 RepID=A0ABU0ZI93_9ACTN|nr:amidohydrolase family protein [Phytohabitans sp. ZYX-F-186]MDQ7906092.1 amidohydrolase family protein [Phytohabitans sp. ZYX-F-186]